MSTVDPIPAYRPQLSEWSLPCGPLTKMGYGPGYFYSSIMSSTSVLSSYTVSSSCGPPGWYDTSRSLYVLYQSPAICPSGYTVACTWFDSYQGPTPLPGEEVWNCVPR